MRFRGVQTFVGRRDELALIDDLCDQLAAGNGGVLLIGGEPGIGKTRLAEVVANRAVERSGQSYWGTCIEETASPPYWPWRQFLRRYGGGDTEGPLRAAISSLIGADGQPTDARILTETDAPEFGAGKAWGAIVDAIRRQSADAPAVLVIDDAQWADRTSLRLLEFTALEALPSPALFVCAFRAQGASSDDQLSLTLAELRRRPRTFEIELGPMDEGEIAEMLGSRGVDAGSPDVIGSLIKLTAGNTFFLAEMAHHFAQSPTAIAELLDGTVAIPSGVKDAVNRRVQSYSPDSRRVLDAAAVIGQEFDVATLAALTEHSVTEVLPTLDELSRARLIHQARRNTVTYEFLHPLIREAIVDRLPISERMKLHSGLVDIYSESGRSVPRAQILRHALEAEPVRQADEVIRLTMEAAEQALESHAVEEAERLFTTAIERLDRGGDSVQLADALFGFARCRLNGPDFRKRRDGWGFLVRAFEMYLALGESDSAVKLAVYPAQLGGAHNPAAVTRRALDLVRPDSPEYGWLLARHSVALATGGDLSQGAAFLDRALAVSRESNNRRLEARVLAHAAQQAHYVEDWPRVLALATESIKIAREVEDPYTEGRLGGWVIEPTVALGDLETGTRLVREQVELARRLHHAGWLEHDLTSAVPLYRAAGKWSEAEAAALQLQSVSPRSPTLAHLPAIYYETGRDEEARRLLAAMVETWRSVDEERWVAIDHAPLASLCVVGAVGDQELLEQLWAAANASRDLVRISGGHSELDRLIAVLSFSREPAVAEQHHSRLFEGDPPFWFDANLSASLLRISGMTAFRAGFTERAIQQFQRASDTAEALGYRPEFVWASYFLGLAHTAAGDRVEARRAAEVARPVAEDLRMAAAIRKLDDFEADVSPADGGSYPDNLSEREVEVLRLLAAGRSNREIADALFISQNTVIRHVSNIYSKTGCSTRVGAAVYARDHGLANEP